MHDSEFKIFKCNTELQCSSVHPLREMTCFSSLPCCLEQSFFWLAAPHKCHYVKYWAKRKNCLNLAPHTLTSLLEILSVFNCHLFENKVPLTMHCCFISSQGAGDSFIGALAFYMANHPHMPLEEMARRANLVAGVSVREIGTQTSFPYRRDLPNEYFQE